MEQPTSPSAGIALILKKVRLMIDELEAQLAPQQKDGTDHALCTYVSTKKKREYKDSDLVSLSRAYKEQQSGQLKSPLEDETIANRAARLIQRYGELYRQHRGNAKLKQFRTRPTIDWQEACSVVATWDDATLEKLMVIVLTTDDEWISRSDRSFRVFAMKASWADDRLKQWQQRQENS